VLGLLGSAPGAATPGNELSVTIRAFSSAVHRRRRAGSFTQQIIITWISIHRLFLEVQRSTTRLLPSIVTSTPKIIHPPESSGFTLFKLDQGFYDPVHRIMRKQPVIARSYIGRRQDNRKQSEPHRVKGAGYTREIEQIDVRVKQKISRSGERAEISRIYNRTRACRIVSIYEVPTHAPQHVVVDRPGFEIADQ